MSIRNFIFLCIACTQCCDTLADDLINTHQICAEVHHIDFPHQDRPAPEKIKSLINCSSVDLYFGIGQPKDWVRARQCAFLEIEKGDENIWGGSSILMMIYANEQGTERNLDLALKLACENDFAPGGGQEFRIKHLAKLRKEKWEGSSFSICDDTTSGYWQGNCEWLKERIAKDKRNNRLKAITLKWSELKQKEFVWLENKFNHFVKLRTNNEVDLSGTARSAMQIEEESSLRNEFLTKVEMLNNDTPPQFTPDQYAEADKEINSIYTKILSKPDFSYGSVTRDGIKQTQRSWLAYRDAWVIFGQHQFPTVSKESWKTWLTKERTRMLKDLLE